MVHYKGVNKSICFASFYQSAQIVFQGMCTVVSRILLQPDDSLQILEPVEADVGFYTCNATNALGSDSVSIAVTLAATVHFSDRLNILCALGLQY
ncbi:UNVERIFIED_CONTAM: hypothetical protein K2H54_040009 [Gekko kuhli]